MKFDRSMLLLYAVTDRTWTGKMTLEQQVEAALQGGVTMVQLREKELGDGDFLEEAVKMRSLTKAYHVPLIINDSIKIALACDADGVHVGQGDMEAGKARSLIGPDKILGVTAKTVEQAVLAEKNGADYLGVGAVFGSKTKKDAVPMTVERLKAIAGAVSIPIVAIGGISGENVLELKGSGIAGAAVVSGIFAAGDIRAAALNLLGKIKIVTGQGEG
ncbi:thiamine phosphate synthase [Clostridium sp. MCC353]|uniref:thiamine phosphate synthase n=1 Tax=Clostridium sp. MCC353 TaxID=2592646 RepID=UPI001C019C78|nr:thiamine phosphate synthase [Clostridium sp. MCC353]MBT9777851.1 thiamine phosphate synthase [Clostridium sp. MCC353]